MSIIRRNINEDLEQLISRDINKRFGVYAQYQGIF